MSSVVIADEDRNVGAVDAGKVLGVGKTTIHRLWDAGELPFTRIGARKTVSLLALRAYKAAHTRQLGAPQDVAGAAAAPTASGRSKAESRGVRSASAFKESIGNGYSRR